MSRRAALLVALCVVPGAVLAACGDDGGDGDLGAFCAAVGELRIRDPFEELTVARPDDVHAAFGELAAGADRIVDAAPPDARIQARRYDEAVDRLMDELAGAAYDPRRLDALRYRRATDEYTTAAVSLDNAARSVCS